MREVILTIGPKGAGKTEFCRKVISTHPEITYVDRDKVFTEILETAPPSTDIARSVTDKLTDIVADYLEKPDVRILLDCWNRCPHERIFITQRLRFFGADRIGGWYFITPKRACTTWFMEREGAKDPTLVGDKKLRLLLSHKQDYDDYHNQPVTLNQGFNFITRIDPSSGELPPFVDLFWPVKLNH